jgi:hypothetical protein
VITALPCYYGFTTATRRSSLWVDPAFGDLPDLVAYADMNGQLGPGGLDGFARIVVPGDIAGGPYVSNLVALAVFDASVPDMSVLVLLKLVSPFGNV